MKSTFLILMLALTVLGGHSDGANAKPCGEIEVTLKKVKSEKTDVVKTINLGMATPHKTYCVDLLHNKNKVAQVQFVYYGLNKATGQEIWGNFKIVSQTDKSFHLYFADNGHKNPPKMITESHKLTAATKVGTCILGEPIVFHPGLHKKTIEFYQLDTTGNTDFSDFNTWASQACKAK